MFYYLYLNVIFNFLLTNLSPLAILAIQEIAIFNFLAASLILLNSIISLVVKLVAIIGFFCNSAFFGHIPFVTHYKV